MHMTALLTRWRSDKGMTTAEYAVGTCAAAGFGGVLIKILTSTPVEQLIISIFKRAFEFLFN